MKNVPQLARIPLSGDQLWINNASTGYQMPKMKELREFLLGEGMLEKKDLMKLLNTFTQYMKQ